MHLFVVDLSVSLDMLSPIIYLINKKKQKVFFINVNPIQDYNKKNNKLINFLSKNKRFEKIDNNLGNFKFLFVCYLFKFISFFSVRIFKKNLYWLWKKIWISKFYLSEKFIEDIILKKKVKSITILEDLPREKKALFFKIKNKTNIPLIMINGGINTKPSTADHGLLKPDFYLASNLTKNHKRIKKSSYFKVFGCLRYSKFWINTLDKVYEIKKKKNKKFTIGIFTNQSSSFSYEMNNLIKNLKEKNFNIIINSKPREILPFNLTFQSREISSSETIEYSDVIISHSTSVIVEAIQRERQIIFPNYLKNFYKEEKKSLFQNNPRFFYPNSFENLLKLIRKIQFKKKYVYRKKDSFIKNLVNIKNDKIENRYVKFYKQFY